MVIRRLPRHSRKGPHSTLEVMVLGPFHRIRTICSLRSQLRSGLPFPANQLGRVVDLRSSQQGKGLAPYSTAFQVVEGPTAKLIVCGVGRFVETGLSR